MSDKVTSPMIVETSDILLRHGDARLVMEIKANLPNILSAPFNLAHKFGNSKLSNHYRDA